MDEIRYGVDAGVATLTIDRPAKKGAMTFAMLAEFTARIAEAGADPAVAVLVVTGVPGSFCAGIDLADPASRAPDDRGAGGERAPRSSCSRGRGGG
ncbi:enoyl-CoA hydratase/isomerase family protein [Pseudonocardia oroxyli]|uniref:Enoyl-CoA hydratase/isomerase n=1 Tax=Pseudonocardia oroxyli TaxID=366584 RepID=A0A1G7NKY5_PSEOR|nr:enoyl-CoA hydratase/isomerase family protein [Pseudonocardia oroxyli]SDF74765.1 Enoyl-CoA hydratase/isomerase [Pseudonocardia oroxyli]